MYVKKLAARRVALQLSQAGGAVLAGLDGPAARAFAAQVRAFRLCWEKSIANGFASEVYLACLLPGCAGVCGLVVSLSWNFCP